MARPASPRHPRRPGRHPAPGRTLDLPATPAPDGRPRPFPRGGASWTVCRTLGPRR
ncbi:hypothetical protein SBRY_60271 [Actinacidiphila bryophytorum]|uniref:Uncharacterized protein n=1 Tax=Actinacidiphila bryophytorum TaxID=1436133 RepID=A0A9W4H680_9ACTN|nr:hypothetical protein SBRY_60271 [Actinacidiphila bryophytorum]